MAKAPKHKSAAKSVKAVKKTATAKESVKKSVPKKAAPKVAATKAKKSVAKAVRKPVAKAMAPKKASKIAPKATAKSPMGNVKAAKKSPSAAFASFFTPLDDRVLVERSAVAERTAGGLYLPETVSASERPNQGRVVAVGSGHRDKKGRLHPLDVQLGDTVMYAGFSGSEVRINDQELLVLREKDIIAIVKL